MSSFGSGGSGWSSCTFSVCSIWVAVDCVVLMGDDCMRFGCCLWSSPWSSSDVCSFSVCMRGLRMEASACRLSQSSVGDPSHSIVVSFV